MQTAYHPAFGERVRFSFSALPDSPDGQVRSTIHEIIRLIRDDAMTPEVQRDARQYLAQGKGDPITGAWNFREKMKFQNDEVTANDLDSPDKRIADTVEVLIRPRDQAKLIDLKSIGIEDC